MNEQTLGSYVLEDRFAVGGMAEIFRARRQGPGGFDKRVAIKRLLPDLSRDPEFVAMFLEEARLASQASSPNLVQVFDFGQAEGNYFLAMELVEGLDLSALLCAAGPLPVDLALFVTIELCRGLEALHAATDPEGTPLGIVHRDVTPGNALVSLRGEVKLGDFGIAKARARGLRTEKGAIKGKLAYLSPEQARGDEVDARTDLYGLGLIAFELLTGERFLPETQEARLLLAAARPQWRPPSGLRPELSPALDTVLQRALAADPAGRYPDARRFRLALESASPEFRDAAQKLGDLVRRSCEIQPPASPASPSPRAPAPPLPTPPPAARALTERLPAPGSRGLGPLAIAGLAVAAAGALGAGLWLGTRAPEPEPEPVPVAVSLPLSESRPLAPVDAPPVPAPGSRSEPPARVASPPLELTRRTSPKRPAPQPPTSVAREVEERRPPLPAPTLPAPPAPTRPSFVAELASLDQLFSTRGLLPADAPELFAARAELGAAVARGEAGSAEIESLRGRIAAFRIDRAFIEGKLDRLQRRLELGGLSQDSRQDFLRRSQAALSQVVTGNHAQANLELNALAAIVEPPRNP